jgi:hypothetical protein
MEVRWGHVGGGNYVRRLYPPHVATSSDPRRLLSGGRGCAPGFSGRQTALTAESDVFSPAAPQAVPEFFQHHRNLMQENWSFDSVIESTSWRISLLKINYTENSNLHLIQHHGRRQRNGGLGRRNWSKFCMLGSQVMMVRLVRQANTKRSIHRSMREKSRRVGPRRCNDS